MEKKRKNMGLIFNFNAFSQLVTQYLNGTKKIEDLKTYIESLSDLNKRSEDRFKKTPLESLLWSALVKKDDEEYNKLILDVIEKTDANVITRYTLKEAVKKGIPEFVQKIVDKMPEQNIQKDKDIILCSNNEEIMAILYNNKIIERQACRGEEKDNLLKDVLLDNPNYTVEQAHDESKRIEEEIAYDKWKSRNLELKKDVSELPNKHLQIYLHPFLFEGNLTGLPSYMEVIHPKSVGEFNKKVNRKFQNITNMCVGLNEEHLKYNLLISPILAFLYSSTKLFGILALNPNENKMHIEIVCAKSQKYKNIGRFLINIANDIGVKLGKTRITLDAVHQAVPFYHKMDFKEITNNTVPMEKPITNNSLKEMPNVMSYRRSARTTPKEIIYEWRYHTTLHAEDNAYKFINKVMGTNFTKNRGEYETSEYKLSFDYDILYIYFHTLDEPKQVIEIVSKIADAIGESSDYYEFFDEITDDFITLIVSDYNLESSAKTVESASPAAKSASPAAKSSSSKSKSKGGKSQTRKKQRKD